MMYFLSKAKDPSKFLIGQDRSSSHLRICGPSMFPWSCTVLEKISAAPPCCCPNTCLDNEPRGCASEEQQGDATEILSRTIQEHKKLLLGPHILELSKVCGQFKISSYKYDELPSHIYNQRLPTERCRLRMHVH